MKGWLMKYLATEAITEDLWICTKFVIHTAKNNLMKNMEREKNISIGKQYFISTILLFFFIILLNSVQNIIGYETVSMILLLIIFILPIFNFSKGPIILSAVISALAWDYYFIPPHFTMHIARAEDVMMLFMFFIVAVTNGVLASKVSTQKMEILKKERRFRALYNLVKDLSFSKDFDETLSKIAQQVKIVFGFDMVFFFYENSEQLKREPHPASTFVPDELEWLAANAAFTMKVPGGKTTSVVGNAEALYRPLTDDSGNVVGIIGIRLNDEIRYDKDELEFLKSFIEELKPYLRIKNNYFKP